MRTKVLRLLCLLYILMASSSSSALTLSSIISLTQIIQRKLLFIIIFKSFQRKSLFSLLLLSQLETFSIPDLDLTEPFSPVLLLQILMEQQLLKIAISGPTLASLLQRLIASPADMEGLIFGHVTVVKPTTDDSASSSSSSSDHPHLIATITSFLSFSSRLSFYDPLESLRLGPRRYKNLLGWFSGRRRSALRPSMRDFSVSSSFSKSTNYNNAAASNDISTSFVNFSPCIFLLIVTPIQRSLVHTHEYRAYQYVASKESFQEKSVQVVNIGPVFRGDYGNFSPTSPLPMLSCEMRGSSMIMIEEDSLRESEGERRTRGSWIRGRRVFKFRN